MEKLFLSNPHVLVRFYTVPQRGNHFAALGRQKQLPWFPSFQSRFLSKTTEGLILSREGARGYDGSSLAITYQEEVPRCMFILIPQWFFCDLVYAGTFTYGEYPAVEKDTFFSISYFKNYVYFVCVVQFRNNIRYYGEALFSRRFPRPCCLLSVQAEFYLYVEGDLR